MYTHEIIFFHLIFIIRNAEARQRLVRHHNAAKHYNAFCFAETLINIFCCGFCCSKCLCLKWIERYNTETITITIIENEEEYVKVQLASRFIHQIDIFKLSAHAPFLFLLASNLYTMIFWWKLEYRRYKQYNEPKKTNRIEELFSKPKWTGAFDTRKSNANEYSHKRETKINCVFCSSHNYANKMNEKKIVYNFFHSSIFSVTVFIIPNDVHYCSLSSTIFFLSYFYSFQMWTRLLKTNKFQLKWQII